MRHGAVLLPIALCALCLRLPGLFWGVALHERLQVDETQHVGIALNVLRRLDEAMVPASLVTPQWNARALGVQIAVLGYPILRSFRLDPYWLFPLGRLLVLQYSVGLIVVTYLLTFRISHRVDAAALAAALLAVFDLEATYAHTAVPVVPHTFFAYSTLLLLGASLRPHLEPRQFWRLLAMAGVGVGVGFATRFEVVVPLVAAAALLFRSRGSRSSGAAVIQHLGVLIVVAGAACYIATGSDYGVADARRSLDGLLTGSRDVIPVDAHWVWNPLLYGAAIVAGTSVPAMALFVAGTRRVGRELLASIDGRLLVAFVVGTAALLYVGDATFVRRAEVFLPFIAIVAGWGGMRLLEDVSRRSARLMIAGVLAYTAALTAVSQWQFVRDTRYVAAEFLAERFPATPIGYSEYARLARMPAGVSITQVGDQVGALPPVLVLHEARYGRYSRYFTTPFKTPRCCDEVYHCVLGECVFVQALFAGATPYQLLKTIAAPEVFPERIGFKVLFGTYETMLGDVLIYVDPDRARPATFG